MNDDLISREALKKEMDRPFWEKWEWEFICKSIDNAPTAVDLPELKEAYQDGYKDRQNDRSQGEWRITDAYPHKVYCSVCYKTFADSKWEVWKDGSLPRAYCPNCGADMRGEKK